MTQEFNVNFTYQQLHPMKVTFERKTRMVNTN